MHPGMVKLLLKSIKQIIIFVSIIFLLSLSSSNNSALTPPYEKDAVIIGGGEFEIVKIRIEECWGLDVGDLNNDDLMDVVVANSENLTWLKSPRDVLGNWTSYTIDDKVGRAMKIGDINGDLKIDIVAVTGDYGKDRALVWYENINADSNIWQRHNILTSIEEIGNNLDLADMNNDGDLDIILSCDTDPRGLYIFENSEKGTSWQKIMVDQIINFYTLGCDLNNDGWNDILHASGQSADRVNWFEHPRNSTGEWNNTFISEIEYPFSIITGDLNNDNKLDLVVSGWIWESGYNRKGLYCYVQKNIGENDWDEKIIDKGGFYRYNLIADINMDGNLDILSQGDDHELLFFNNSKGNGLDFEKELIKKKNSERFFPGIEGIRFEEFTIKNKTNIVLTTESYVYILINKEAIDYDNDDIPDYKDSNDDNDEYLDIIDAFPTDEAAYRDTDQDNMPDDLDMMKNPSSQLVEDLDDDNDGLLDIEEKNLGTNPLLKDTDGDGFEDKVEVDKNTDPLDDKDYPGQKRGASNLFIFFFIIICIILIILALFHQYKNNRKNSDFQSTTKEVQIYEQSQSKKIEQSKSLEIPQSQSSRFSPPPQNNPYYPPVQYRYCPRCNHPMMFIPHYGQFYCNYCRDYER
jgi:hypothetical protein